MDTTAWTLVRGRPRPISGDTGLRDVQRLAEAGDFRTGERRPRACSLSKSACATPTSTTCSAISVLAQSHPLKLVFNAGTAARRGRSLTPSARKKALGAGEFIKIHNTPDGTFPNGIPNPLRCRVSRRHPQRPLLNTGADMGIAFDGDFDRCFLFDERAVYRGYYIIGLLAEAFLEKHRGRRLSTTRA